MYWTTSQFMLRQPEAETRLTCCCYCTDCSPLWADTSVCFDKFSFIYTATNHQEEKWEPRTSACSQSKEPSKCISFTEYDTCLQVNRQEVVSWLEPVIWTLTHGGRLKGFCRLPTLCLPQAQSLLTPTGSRQSSIWMITWLWRLERKSLAPSAWSQMSRTM